MSKLQFQSMVNEGRIENLLRQFRRKNPSGAEHQIHWCSLPSECLTQPRGRLTWTFGTHCQVNAQWFSGTARCCIRVLTFKLIWIDDPTWLFDATSIFFSLKYPILNKIAIRKIKLDNLAKLNQLHNQQY